MFALPERSATWLGLRSAVAHRCFRVVGIVIAFACAVYLAKDASLLSPDESRWPR